MNRILSTLVLLLHFHAFLCAQTTTPEDAAVRREYTKTSFTNALRAEYGLKKGGSLFWEGNYNHNISYSYLTNGYKLYNHVGAEIAATSFWYLGASLKHQISYYPGFNTTNLRANITHRGKIGKFYFHKEIGGEYILHQTPFFKDYKNARVSFAFGLIKKLEIAKQPLFIAFFYKAYLNTHLGEIYNKRKMDFIKTRLEIIYNVYKQLHVGFYGMLDSERFYSLARYDMNGNEINPDYRRNRINPVVGISLNLVFKAKESEKEFIPGLPFH
jgi:hypothetical protein